MSQDPIASFPPAGGSADPTYTELGLYVQANLHFFLGAGLQLSVVHVSGGTDPGWHLMATPSAGGGFSLGAGAGLIVGGGTGSPAGPAAGMGGTVTVFEGGIAVSVNSAGEATGVTVQGGGSVGAPVGVTLDISDTIDLCK